MMTLLRYGVNNVQPPSSLHSESGSYAPSPASLSNMNQSRDSAGKGGTCETLALWGERSLENPGAFDAAGQVIHFQKGHPHLYIFPGKTYTKEQSLFRAQIRLSLLITL